MLNDFMVSMSQLVVRHGEGATKFITIRIRNAPGQTVARHIASMIARSVLVIGGKGLIVPELTLVSFVPANGPSEIEFLERGARRHVDEVEAKEAMEHEDVDLLAHLRVDGNGNADGGLCGGDVVYWTCDLTHEFVTMNAGGGDLKAAEKEALFNLEVIALWQY